MRVLHDTLVAAAVEQERRAVAVARVLDLTEKQRMVAAPVAANDPCDEIRERVLHERRVVDELEHRLR